MVEVCMCGVVSKRYMFILAQCTHLANALIFEVALSVMILRTLVLWIIISERSANSLDVNIV